MGVFLGRLARAVDDRLVIAGQESRGLAERRDAHRAEVLLEELARLLGVLRLGLDGGLARFDEARGTPAGPARADGVLRRIALQLAMKVANAAA